LSCEADDHFVSLVNRAMSKRWPFNCLIVRILSSAIAFAGLACSEGNSGGGPAAGTGGTHATGAAGSTGAAGTTGATGAAGSTGATGAAGSTGAAAGRSGAAGTTGFGGASGAGTCISGATAPPVAALITDFSDAIPDTGSSGQFKFGGGVASAVQGGTSEFADTTEAKPVLGLSGGALSVNATSKGSYTGVILYMNGPACIDGSAYTGVQFDLDGNVGTCGLTFGFGFADDLAPSSDSQRGICAATNCYGPSVAVTTTGTVKVPYTAVSGGSPDMAVDRQKLTGVQWQLQSTATGTTCTASFTIDNVKFY
jgi:hypothetical protein